MADDMQSESDDALTNPLASLDGGHPTHVEHEHGHGHALLPHAAQHDEVYMYLVQEKLRLSFSVQNIILRFISAFRDTFSISKKVINIHMLSICAVLPPLIACVHGSAVPLRRAAGALGRRRQGGGRRAHQVVLPALPGRRGQLPGQGRVQSLAQAHLQPAQR